MRWRARCGRSSTRSRARRLRHAEPRSRCHKRSRAHRAEFRRAARRTFAMEHRIIRNQFGVRGFCSRGAEKENVHVRRRRPRHVPLPPRKARPLRRDEPLHRRLLQLRGDLHRLRRRLPVRARRRASGRLHPAQSRLRRGVQRHRQHHVALQQGRPPAAARSAAGELHRVLPRLRRRNARATREMHQHCAVCAEACTACAEACNDMLSTMRMPA